ncbi:unnamed protein product [Arabis nemorensis]|uniref:UVR domain-containing protein n=1 Tax=Arabis nemorensis TaxID=586526 RepID=A0A565AR52_9BRAS|nr:unnamed protein product [Arabis nemorensis]
MTSLQAPVVCPNVRLRQLCVNCSVSKPRLLVRNQFLGNQTRNVKSEVAKTVTRRRCKSIQCLFNSHSDGTGSTAEDFNENDEDYVNSSVLETVEVRSGADGFMVKMRDGRQLGCVHNNPQGGHLPNYAPHSAIVLKMEDGTGLLLPIIVLEMPSVLLMAAMTNIQIARPTMYQVVKEMVDKNGLRGKPYDGALTSYWFDHWLDIGPLIDLVGPDGPRLLGIQESTTVAAACSLSGWRLPSHRNRNSALALLRDWSDLLRWLSNPSPKPIATLRCLVSQVTVFYLWKERNSCLHDGAALSTQVVGNKSDCMSFDLRPSDAINIAVRCKVPIQVNKYLAYSDGMRVIESGKLSKQTPTSDGLLFTELDRPNGQPCLDTKEFDLLSNMMQAVNEERYDEAAEWRDKLGQFRAKRKLRKYT